MTTSIKTVALYCRVDSGANLVAQQQAVLRQKSQLEDYARRNHLVVAASYEDMGYSGHNNSRPGWIALQQGFLEGKFDAVLVVNHSRLIRINSPFALPIPFPVISLDSLQHHKER